MRVSPGSRRVALTAHIVASVGWLGAIAVSAALAVTGLTSQDADVVRAAYVALDSISWSVLVPLSLASLLTGLVQSLGTPWGLFRHYWTLVKFAITILATAVLLLYTQTLSSLAAMASSAGSSGADLSAFRSASPLLHSAAALVMLLVAATLSVFKPRGLTPYGWRKVSRSAGYGGGRQPPPE